MSLPARQQRALDRIDQKLAVDDPRLGSMFAIFTRLTLDQPMPATERDGAGPGLPPFRPMAGVAVSAEAVTAAAAATVKVTSFSGLSQRFGAAAASEYAKTY